MRVPTQERGWAWIEEVAVRDTVKMNQQDVDGRCHNTGDWEEGDCLPARWWPGQDKVTSRDLSGFVVGIK